MSFANTMRALQLETLGQKSQFRTHCKTVKLCVSKYNRCHTHIHTHTCTVKLYCIYICCFCCCCCSCAILTAPLTLTWLGAFSSPAMVASIDPTVRARVVATVKGEQGAHWRESNKYSWVFLSIRLEQKKSDENAVCAALSPSPSLSPSHYSLLLLTQRPLPRGR